ncbi:hypothetical protein DYB32_009982 [Aphanomyces invadans]|uniref:Protein kinase domain-containing protein n=1 Tax=Aphanomyces invadans TaxID=157072 RepID=A0A3R6VEH2_9STRA|nr:hypothetical protein DYB32_009982 [Aphanomyces invadans]
MSNSIVELKGLTVSSYSSVSYALSEMSASYMDESTATLVVPLPSTFDKLVTASSIKLPRKQGVLQIPTTASRWMPWRKKAVTWVDCWVTFNGRELSWFKSTGHGLYKSTPVCSLDLSTSMRVQFHDLTAEMFAIVEVGCSNHSTTHRTLGRRKSSSSDGTTKTRHVFTAASAADKLSWLQVLSEALHIQDWFAGFQVGPLLGQGGSSQVHLLTDTASESTFALKSIETHNRPDNAELASNEIEILQLLATCGSKSWVGAHTTKLYKTVEDHTGRIGLVMAYHRGGNLSDRIAQGGLLALRNCMAREEAAKRLAYTLLSTLHELHTLGVLHLDIKPANILFHDTNDDVGKMILADFGFAHRIALHDPEVDDDAPPTTRGTVGYMAPELVEYQFGRNTLDGSPPLTPAADVFSAGVVLFEFLVGFAPFHSSQSDKVIERMLRGHMVRPQAQWGLVSAEGQRFLLAMLARTPSHRPTVADLLSQPWLHH